jgi:hypothetical protein
MAGKWKKWPYPAMCPVCSGAVYDKSWGDTPYVCELLGNDGNSRAFGNPNAPLGCRDYRKGKMRVAEGMDASMGFKSKAKSDGGKVFEGAGQILRNVSGSGSLSADELVGGGAKIVGGVVGGVVKGAAKGIKYASEKVEELERQRIEAMIQDSWEAISNVTFSNTKQTIEEIDDLLDIFSTVYHYSNDTMGLENREAIADACLTKLEEGIGAYRNAPDRDAKKADAFQIELQECKLNRLQIKDYSEAGDVKAAFYNKNITIINSVSFDGSTKLVIKSLDSLFSIKSALFSFMSLVPIKSPLFSFLSGKGITSDQKLFLCNSAIEKIEQGVTAYKNDPYHDAVKLAKYEAALGEFRISRNGIIFSLGQKLDAEAVKNIVNNISLNGSSAFIEAGMEALIIVKYALFVMFSPGKKIPSADKKEISDAAIEKMECGITALKNDPVYKVKKLAKYEKELAGFREKRETIRGA